MAQYMPTGAPKGGASFAWALPGFDQAEFDASLAGRNAARMQALYSRYADDEMHPDVVAYWRTAGLRKELFDEDTDGKYSVFTPLDLEGDRLLPLVYVSHGGMEPINKTETNGFPLLAGRHGFICVCPWNGGPSNDAVESEFSRILQQLLDRGYPIDLQRIYAVGYSAGSDATGVLACAYPDILAAVSPDPGGNLFAKGRWYADPESYRKNLAQRLPMIAVGGTMDGGDRYPLTEPHHLENFDIWMRDIVHVPNRSSLSLAESRRLVEASDDPTKRAFGFDFDRTFSARLEDREWLFGDYVDEAGTAIARFATGVGLPHAQTAVHAPIIWDFIRHFARDRETGNSVYTPVVVDEVPLRPVDQTVDVPA